MDEYPSSWKDYPYLRDFLMSYFLPGLAETWDIPKIVAEWAGEAYFAEDLGLRADIHRFVRDHPTDSNEAFGKYLTGSIRTQGFGKEPIPWLLDLEALVKGYEGKIPLTI